MGLSCQKHPQNEVLHLVTFVLEKKNGYEIYLLTLYMTLNHQTNDIN